MGQGQLLFNRKEEEGKEEEMRVFINGKHTPSGKPFYSLMEMSAATGWPVYGGGPADVVFNWGGGGFRAPAGAVVLNRNPIFDKYSQAKAMSKAGVATPQPYRTLKDVKCFPVLRKPINSYGGRGIRLVKGRRGAENLRYWYQGFVRKAREFRVYFFNGEICLMEEKIIADKTKLTWNHANCLRWEECNDLGAERVRDLVIPAAEAIRIDWGAADVLVARTGQRWICEINSRPSCWGGVKPKLKMTVKNGLYTLVGRQKADLDYSALLWAEKMHEFVEDLDELHK